jgi:hypothetical protein
MIDGEEQNEIRPDGLFRMFEHARPEHLEVDEQADSMRYRGRHRGYTRMPEPVVHERTLTLSRRDSTLTIADVLQGRGTHRLRWHFHLAPGIEASIGLSDGVDIRAGAMVLKMTVSPALRPTVTPGWYSPSYGVRTPCVCLDFDVEERIAGRCEYQFRIAP